MNAQIENMLSMISEVNLENPD